MDFFEHQDAARRKTSVLVVLFVAAVALIILAVYGVVLTIFLNQMHSYEPSSPGAWWQPQLFFPVAAATLLLITVGSLYKIGTLRGGGAVVASQLGASKISPGTQDLRERVLLNVVEEMAIASGVPVPAVYVMDQEQGINAFAAGFTPDDAVIGVTRGCLETLSRDELQGVIAHEFSHILHGDMRLNLRLIGILHGILLLALIGEVLLRSMRHSRRSKKGAGGVLLAGLALFVIGYVGLFFGKLIKSAVSRQREFLADASAVQFTRNPGGLSGALKRIGGLARGSLITEANPREASHLFFGNALQTSLFALLSTHPPLDVRIKRIDPSFDGRIERTTPHAYTPQELHPLQAAAADPVAMPAGQQVIQAELVPLVAEQFVDRVGTPGAEHVAYAAALLSSLPETLAREVHEPLGAVATVYSLLVSDEAAIQAEQLGYLAKQSAEAAGEVRRLLPLIKPLPAQTRLPLVEMALPALNELSDEQQQQLRDTVQRLIAADRRISLFEYALQRVLLKHLARHFGQPRPPAIKYHSLRPLLPACGRLLSLLAHAGHRGQDASAAQAAFSQGAAHLHVKDQELLLLARQECRLSAMDEALDRLASASPQIKKRVLEACAACIAADGQVTIEEGELLRVFADALDCPAPPLLASGRV